MIQSCSSFASSCRYLYQLFNSKGWLPRRQEAEDEKVNGEDALVTHQEVRDWGDERRDAMIVSVSHAWETREHPDPCRFQLQNLGQCLKLYDAAYSSDLWIFFDYTSLFQWRRDANHELSYQRAMRNVQVLYAHRSTLTFRMECLTPQAMWTAAENDPTFKIPVYHGPSRMVVPLPLKELVRNSNLYLVRGWCLAEREWSASRSVMEQNVAIDGGSGEDQEIKKNPTSPDVFHQRMAQSVFTHRVDCDSVIELQKKIFHAKVTIRKQLVLDHLTNADVDELAASLPHYRSLKVLKIDRFTADVEQVIAFAQAELPFMSLFFLQEEICWRSWVVQSVFFLNARKQHFAWQALRSLPLQKLELRHLEGPEGTGVASAQARSLRSVRSDFCGSLWSLHQALAAMLKDHKSLKKLVLNWCEVGDVGAQALGFWWVLLFLIGGIFHHFPQIPVDFHEFVARRLWPMHWSTTIPSPISTSVQIRLVIRGSRPGSCNSQFLSNFTFCTAQALANAMQHDQSLSYLNLWGNQIGDNGVEARVVQFSNLDFTFCTSQALANAMPQNKTLTILDLRRNPFGHAGKQARWVA